MSNATLQRYRITLPYAPMRAKPCEQSECTNECLYGERVQSISTSLAQPLSNSSRVETTDQAGHAQWLNVTAERDGYCGYMQVSQLQAIAANTPATSHWVSARSTLVFSQDSIKSRVLTRLPFLSRVVSHCLPDSNFNQLEDGTYIWHQHLLPADEYIQHSAIELALSHFIGAPYLWGGCSPSGLDCSGLIQALAQAKGLSIPRDSGDQESALKNTIAMGERQSQDLVYWPGHTGILLDADTIVHATAHHLGCVVEPLQDVIARAGNISSIKRLFD